MNAHSMRSVSNSTCMRHAVALAIVVPGIVLGPSVARSSDDGGSRTLLGEATGPRALGMGGSFAAISDDATATFWNPGGLGWIDRKQLQIGYRGVDIADLRETSIGAAIPSWRWGAAGFLFRQIRSSDIEGRDENNVVTDTDLSDVQSEVLLAYGRNLGNGVGLGGALKWRQQSLAGSSASAVGADLGALVRLADTPLMTPDWMSGLQFGISLRNVIEPKLRLVQESVSDPLQVRAGMAQRFEIAGRPLLAALDIERGRGRDTRAYLGLEVELHPAISLRTGVGSGVNAGASISSHGVAFEYAHLDETLFDSRMLGLGWRFGPTTEDARAAAFSARQDEVRRELAASLTRNEEERFTDLLHRAQTALDEDRFDQAIELLGAAEVVSPGKMETKLRLAGAWRARGLALESTGDLANAAAAFQRALSYVTEDSVAASGALRTQEESHRRANRTEYVRAQFAEALRLYGNGELLRCREVLEEILRAEPGDLDARRLLASAETTLARQIGALTDQAKRFLDAGLLEDANHAVKTGRSLDPENTELAQLEQRIDERTRFADGFRAPSRQSADETRSAEVDAVQPSVAPAVTAQHRREAEQLYQIGRQRFEAGDAQAAIREWERALEVYPGHLPSRERLCAEHLTRGLAAFSKGALDEAILAWEAAVRLDPSDGRAAGYLARARDQLARTDEILDDQNSK